MKKTQPIVSSIIPTRYGVFRIFVWQKCPGQEPLALCSPTLDTSKEVLLRIHSECLTGDVFGSLTCDCGPQKAKALELIAKHGNGVFIYHRQEGRNMGLFKKIQAYNLMSEGIDTHDANTLLSGGPDMREYSDVIEILELLCNKQKPSLILLSNNPYKKLVLERIGYHVKMQPLEITETIHSSAYVATKKQKFLHYAPTYEPYVGVTLYRTDISSNQAKIADLINSFDSNGRGRKIFIGIPIFPDKGELEDSEFTHIINDFASYFKENNSVYLVLHIDYSGHRKYFRDLRNFLNLLTFDYSLQFRIQKKENLPKIDLEILQSWHAKHIIFQIRKEQHPLLESQKFLEDLTMNNVFLLLDESFGTGSIENFIAIKSKVAEIIKRGISHIAIAGGYNSKKVKDIIALEDYFKIPISIDAESKLRTHNKLNLIEIQKYLAFFFPIIN